MVSEQDRAFMARAIALAKKGLYSVDPNPRVGCVIVKEGRMIAEGWHERAGGPHAEVHALQQIDGNAEGATAYVTLEPCCHQGRTPPCTDALIKSRINRVVIGSLDPNPLVAGQGINKLRNAGIAVDTAVLAEQADALNPGFMKRMRDKRPFVRCKIAMSLDGRTAMASGESQWITGEEARADVHHWRARSSAVLTGIGTLINDNPSLNARLTEQQKGESEFSERDQPLRVVLDTALRFPSNAKMLDLPGKILIYTASDDHNKIKTLTDRGAEIAVIGKGRSGLDLPEVFADMAQRQINEVLTESGATLNGALLSQLLIDELIFYIAPSIMGDLAKGPFHLPQIHKMRDKISLMVRDTRQIGVDWRIIAHLVGKG